MPVWGRVVLAVACLAAVIGIGVVAFGGRGSDPGEATSSAERDGSSVRSSEASSVDHDAQPLEADEADVAPDDPGAAGDQAAPTLAAQIPTTRAAPPIPSTSTTSRSSTIATPPVPGVSTTAASTPSGLAVMPAGSWVDVLESVPYGEGIGAARAWVDQLGEQGHAVTLIDTASHPAMTPGYWAVVVGPFSSEDQARGSCGLAGRAVGPSCYPRVVG